MMSSPGILTVRLWSLLTLAGILPWLSGCATRDLHPTVRRIHFEEETRDARWLRGTSDYNLRAAIEHDSSPLGASLLPWIDPVPLDRGTLQTDAWKIELWYAHQGFFDARFLGWELVERRAESSRRGAVYDLRGRIDEGKESLITQRSFKGLEGMKLLRLEIEQKAPAQEGERFTLANHQATAAMMRQLLQERSFARAEVQGRVDADPAAREVSLVYEAELGESCTFGRFRISPVKDVPMERIHELLREAVRSAQSDAALPAGIQPDPEWTGSRPLTYNPALLTDIQSRLFSLGTFSLVQVVPDLSGEGSEIPVSIQLVETSFREMKLGGGVGTQNGEQVVRLSTELEHVNFLSRLLNLKMGGSGGWKSFGTAEDFVDSIDLVQDDTETGESDPIAGPFGQITTSLSWPRAFGERWTVTQEFEQSWDLEPGYTYDLLSESTGLSYRAGKRHQWNLSQSLHLESWAVGINPDVEGASCEEADCSDYLLFYPKQQIVFDGRDDPLFTHRGRYLSASLSEAGLLGDYEFIKGDLDLRGYLLQGDLQRRLRKTLKLKGGRKWGRQNVIAGRLALGAAAPYGETESLPVAERFTLGGSNSVRGWGRDRLGPRLCELDGAEEDCALLTPDQAVTFYPLGGNLALAGSMEYRMAAPYDMTLVSFLDVGMVWEEIAQVRWRELQPSAGLGFRYASPIGPVRLDWGFRLRDDPLYAADPRYGFHFSLSEAF